MLILPYLVNSFISFFLKVALVNLGPLNFYMPFRLALSISINIQTAEIFDWDSFWNLYIEYHSQNEKGHLRNHPCGAGDGNLHFKV
jgi:hypothetical protein